MWSPILILAAAAAAPVPPADVVSEASGAALQADVRRALQLTAKADPATLSPKDAEFVSCLRQRFAGPPPAKPEPAGFTDRALAIYQSYWRAALTRPETRAEEEERLDSELRALLGARPEDDLDALLEQRIAADGNHSLEGRTGLLRELMVWTGQSEKTVAVELPEGRYEVKVVLLDNFRSFGWSHYATCGRRATGGWATDRALYAVVPRYDSLDGEKFRVSFLGHETQHFADKARFKGLKLEPWEREYRAKLTELALADHTRNEVLGKYIEDQGDDPKSPHSYANRRLLAALVKRLRLSGAAQLLTADRARLTAAARALLLEDSRRRLRRPGR